MSTFSSKTYYMDVDYLIIYFHFVKPQRTQYMAKKTRKLEFNGKPLTNFTMWLNMNMVKSFLIKCIFYNLMSLLEANETFDWRRHQWWLTMMDLSLIAI